MPFEDFDKKVIEAAENHHPVYNENAWPQMEKLLDKHLPQKEDNRRRFIFLLLLLVCLGGGAWLIANKPWEKQQSIVSEASQKKNEQSTTLPVKDESKNGSVVSVPQEKESPGTEDNIVGDENKLTRTTNNVPAIITNDTEKNSAEKSTPSSNKQSLSSDANRLTFNTSTSKKGTRKKSEEIKNTEPSSDLITDNKPGIGDDKSIVIDELSTTNEKKVVVSEVTSVKTPEDIAKIDVVATDAKKDTVATENAVVEAVSTIPTKNKIKPNRNNNNGFAILFAGGLDKSSVGFAKSGITKPIFGAGVSYTFRQWFTISTGVYTARKIYTAAPADYKFAYNPPNINYLKSIDADCQVMEIPLNISWNFMERKKGSFYVSTGASSFIMKNEKYGYVYKYPGGQSYTHKEEYNNKNQHFFSVLNLSAGYKRYFGKSFFAAAEPYVKLPMSGVGEGKVKLNSTGILFTVGIRPFSPRK